MLKSINEEAPNFTSQDQFDKTISLYDILEKSHVILYFYPKNYTPGCTNQACNLSENIQALQNHGLTVIGISKDSIESHQKFSEKYNLKFSLISDSSLEIHNLYGTWQMKKSYGKEYMGTVRTTFLINNEKNILSVIKKPKTKEHSQEIISLLGKINSKI